MVSTLRIPQSGYVSTEDKSRVPTGIQEHIPPGWQRTVSGSMIAFSQATISIVVDYKSAFRITVSGSKELFRLSLRCSHNLSFILSLEIVIHQLRQISVIKILLIIGKSLINTEKTKHWFYYSV